MMLKIWQYLSSFNFMHSRFLFSSIAAYVCMFSFLIFTFLPVVTVLYTVQMTHHFFFCVQIEEAKKKKNEITAEKTSYVITYVTSFVMWTIFILDHFASCNGIVIFLQTSLHIENAWSMELEVHVCIVRYVRCRSIFFLL